MNSQYKQHQANGFCVSCGYKTSRKWHTLCYYCYLKESIESRYKDKRSIENLLVEKVHLQEQLLEAEKECVHSQKNLELYSAKLKSETPRWKNILGISHDIGWEGDPVHEFCAAHVNKENLVDQIKRAEWGIETAKKEKKRFEVEHKRRVRSKEFNEARKKATEKRKKSIYGESIDVIKLPYHRELFVFRKVDYKRGNLLENHFLNGIKDSVLQIFNNSCLFCGSKTNLTLDHFGIPKNEGGNFILLVKENKSIKANIIVLCRSCNAMKGESSYLNFFSQEKIEEIFMLHEKLIDFIVKSPDSLKVISKFYKTNPEFR